MSGKVKKFLMNPWTVTVGGGLILTGITTINDLVKKEEIFSTIKSIVCTLFKWIILFLNLEIKVWWILVTLLGLIAVGGLVIYVVCKAQPDASKPKFIEYREDIILNYKWKWFWGKTYDGKYRIENLHPVCLKCNTPLPQDVFYGNRAKCIRCGNMQYDQFPNIENVEMLIRDNVERKYFSPNDIT